MKCREIQPMMRTFIVRALSFSAVAALTLNPALTPVVASDYRVATPVATDGQMNARFVSLGIGHPAIELAQGIAPGGHGIGRSEFRIALDCLVKQ